MKSFLKPLHIHMTLHLMLLRLLRKVLYTIYIAIKAQLCDMSYQLKI